MSALQNATTTLTYAGGPRVDPQCLTVIAAACRDHERVRFAYTARDDAATRREVEPHSLVNAGRRWYLVAFDCARQGWRTFRVDRLSRPASTGARFRPRSLPGGDPAAFVKQSLANAPHRYEARVTVRAPAEALRRRRWVGGTVEDVDDQTCRYRTSDDDLDWLAMRIAMLGHEFEVDGPPELVERLREIGARVARGVEAAAHRP